MKRKHLLIITYEMNELSQLLSHQVSVVNEFSSHFDRITVLTGKLGKYRVSENIQVHSYNWEQGKKFSSLFRFYRIFLKYLVQNRFTIIFSHMTSVQAAAIAPITKILRIKHYLWYAHTSDNFALKINHLFNNGILTATAGSCPLSGKKIHVIGHSIDSKMFKNKQTLNLPLERFIHIGRIDPVKNLHLIIDTLEEIKSENSSIKLQLIGSPSGEQSFDYYLSVLEKISKLRQIDWVNIEPAVSRESISGVLRSFDVFIHACDAGLDKAILEATFVGLPVVTINKQYLDIFGSWDLHNRSSRYSLREEVQYLRLIQKKDLVEELNRRYLIAKSGYEIEGWAQRAAQVFNS